MAMTSSARNGLNAKIIPHANQASMESTETGLLRGEHGFIIPPSMMDAGTHSAQAKLTEAEMGLFSITESQHAPNRPPARTTRKQKRQTSAQPERHVDTMVYIEESGIEIPTQYTGIYAGTGILVLAMNKYSYTPVRVRQTDNGLTNTLRLSGVKGRYGYMGHSFADADGVQHIVLIRLPEEEPEDDE